MSKIYDDVNGWVNWDYLYNECRFIMAVTGPRQVGKTYGLLKYVLDNKLTFLYLRRLKSQLDACITSADDNPFTALNRTGAYNVEARRKKGTIQFFDVSGDEPAQIGRGGALSTLAELRGIFLGDTDVIVFDEYIPMIGERPIKNEAEGFQNLLETVNSNRELFGKPPVKVFMLGNANKLMNPYFLHWHFMKTALKMIRGNQMMYRTQDNRRIMVLLLNSPISDMKKETVLYKGAESEDFFKMAIDNSFATDETNIKSIKLNDCRHIISIGPIGVYQLKSTGAHYCSETVDKSNQLPDNEIGIKFFRARYAGLKLIYLHGYFVFENYDCELLLREYLGL